MIIISFNDILGGDILIEIRTFYNFLEAVMVLER